MSLRGRGPLNGQQTAERIAAVRPLYGRNTVVGVNRDQAADADAPTDHGLAILRSHAAGWGDCLAPRSIRCALTIRANQLLAGGSGADIGLALTLADLADGPDGDLPQVHRYGALGTSDLTALAEVGMTLLGERPRANGDRRQSYALRSVDALPIWRTPRPTLRTLTNCSIWPSTARPSTRWNVSLAGFAIPTMLHV